MLSKTFKRGLMTAAVPALMLGGMAQAGGLAETIVEPAPMPAPVAPAPIAMGADWTGFYAGGQLGYGNLQSDAFSEDATGALYGVHAGYLYDFGSVVAGAEVDYDLSNIEAASEGTITLDSVARAKLRLGYDAGAFMPYLVGGVALATTGDALDGEGTGTFGGLGIDYQFSPTIRIGAEVLQHQFEDFDDIDGLDIDATTASARVSFQF
ncbi:outer membrane protein [Yoonia sp.]|uniref:outer membrane protein n=1 Tax=Yoonia sp. TaxID=2212373 RepID=UPI002FDB7E29